MLPFPDFEITPRPAFQLEDNHAAELEARRKAMTEAGGKKNKTEATKKSNSTDATSKIHDIKPNPSFKVEENKNETKPGPANTTTEKPKAPAASNSTQEKTPGVKNSLVILKNKVGQPTKILPTSKPILAVKPVEVKQKKSVSALLKTAKPEIKTESKPAV